MEKYKQQIKALENENLKLRKQISIMQKPQEDRIKKEIREELYLERIGVREI